MNCRTLFPATVVFVFFAACSASNGGDEPTMPCDDKASSRCESCLLDAKFVDCHAEYEAATSSCFDCDREAPSCDAERCGLLRSAWDACRTQVEIYKCGVAASGTGGIGGSGSTGGSGGDGGVAGTGGTSGDGGAGGAPGTGGSGGTGGTGGEGPLCGDKVCGVGEKCNRSRNPPRCECTASPVDSCAEADPTLYCSATRVCEKASFEQWGPCNTEGDLSPDGTLVCVGGFGFNGRDSFWMKFCAGQSECKGPEFCDKETFGTDGTRGLCYYNFCGDLQRKQNGTLKNGADWGACDPNAPAPFDASSGSGQCVPLDGTDNPVFICLPGGLKPIGAACRFDADERSAAACAAFSVCVSETLPATSCTTSAQCSGLQVCTNGRCGDKACTSDANCTGGYCYDDGVSKKCKPLGTCTELCNAGTAPDPACSGGQVCLGALTTRPDFSDARGYCTSDGCDMLGGADECPAVGGEPGMCHFDAPMKGHPFMGSCGLKPDSVKAKGAVCAGADVCEQGTLCVGSRTTGTYACRGLCECPYGDWNTTTFVCRTSAAECPTNEACTYFGGEYTLGGCIPK